MERVYTLFCKEKNALKEIYSPLRVRKGDGPGRRSVYPIINNAYDTQ
jgi:hypothetical protein